MLSDADRDKMNEKALEMAAQGVPLVHVKGTVAKPKAGWMKGPRVHYMKSPWPYSLYSSICRKFLLPREDAEKTDKRTNRCGLCTRLRRKEREHAAE